tara:strand:- start:44 stop:400 length:357 start_codon:yes stop_codon:yes gene_type:complete
MKSALVSEYLIRKLGITNFSVDTATGAVNSPTLTTAQQTACDAFVVSSEAAGILLRMRRNSMLARCDWTQGADVPSAIKTPWATYRQQLRDLPASSTPTLNSDGTLNRSSVTWPTKPS